MQVRCVSVVNAHHESVESSDALTVGKEYVVLEISATIGHRVDVRITSDDGTHSLWPIDIFEVVEVSLPSSWTVKIEGQRLVLCPKDWSRHGFWEDYYNDDADAVRQFEVERDRILSED